MIGNKTAYVYVIEIRSDKDECIKIGFTRNIEKRLKQLSYDTKADVTLIDSVYGAKSFMYAFEQFLHNYGFTKYSWNGKHFNGQGELYLKGQDIDLRHMLDTFSYRSNPDRKGLRKRSSRKTGLGRMFNLFI